MILKLKEYRLKKGMSIRSLSISSGVSRAYIRGLENGDYDNPGINVICQLCKVLNVTPNELINEEYWK